MDTKKIDWIQKRYFEFRAGNNLYLGFSAGFASFILIIYRFLIERVISVQSVLGDLLSFTIFFLIIYIPLAAIVGNWHYREQEKIQQTYQFMQNPAIIRAFKLILELKTGTADKNDVESFKQLLRQLDEKVKSKDLM